MFVMFQSSYALGLLLFPDNVPLQLGLFFTGASPAGGASNVWTVLLGGNIDVNMETILVLLALLFFFIFFSFLNLTLIFFATLSLY